MKVIYEEDHQMYFKKYYLIETTFQHDLGKMSWGKRGAGRISTSVEDVEAMVKDLGEQFEIVADLGRSLPKIYCGLPLYRGATGNY